MSFTNKLRNKNNIHEIRAFIFWYHECCYSTLHTEKNKDQLSKLSCIVVRLYCTGKTSSRILNNTSLLRLQQVHKASKISGYMLLCIIPISFSGTNLFSLACISIAWSHITFLRSLQSWHLNAFHLPRHSLSDSSAYANQAPQAIDGSPGCCSICQENASKCLRCYECNLLAPFLENLTTISDLWYTSCRPTSRPNNLLDRTSPCTLPF